MVRKKLVQSLKFKQPLNCPVSMKALRDLAVDQESFYLLVMPPVPGVAAAQGLGLEISQQRVGCCQILHQEIIRGFHRVPRTIPSGTEGCPFTSQGVSGCHVLQWSLLCPLSCGTNTDVRQVKLLAPLLNSDSYYFDSFFWTEFVLQMTHSLISYHLPDRGPLFFEDTQEAAPALELLFTICDRLGARNVQTLDSVGGGTLVPYT